jgi:hypothetical protein
MQDDDVAIGIPDEPHMANAAVFDPQHLAARGPDGVNRSMDVGDT